MISEKKFAFRALLAGGLLLFSLQARSADIPADVQAAISARTGASLELQPPIVDTGRSMPGTYVYFVRNTSDEPGYTKDNKPYMLDAHLLFADANHRWHDQLFDRYLKDDGIPEIAAVFFANADNDPGDKELIVLVRTPLQHYDYGGEYYDGYVYKLTGNAKNGVVFVGLQSDASAPFKDQCECEFRDGHSTQARYKNAEEIRKALAKKFPTVLMRK